MNVKPIRTTSAKSKREQQELFWSAVRLRALDSEVVRYAWCAERIEREARAAIYRFWPSEPTDAAMAATLGIRLHQTLTEPVLVWLNQSEQD
jgi:hypothetical protein